MTTHKEALEAAYLAGFNASGEGYNGEYPFGDKMQDPAENRVWKKDRDNYIKEALAQPEQEPVAWKDEQGNVRMTLDSGEIQSSVGYVYSVHGEHIKNACIRSDIPNGTPLYTSPPQRTWVGLTDEEIAWEFPDGFYGEKITRFARSIEAKLKEKNT